MKKLVIILAVLGLFSECNNSVKQENQRLLVSLDSLQLALNENAKNIDLLEQIGQYLDSIDTNCNWDQLNLETEIYQHDYIQRMRDLNLYVQKTTLTIGELERIKNTYVSQVIRLKKEILNREQEIQTLRLSAVQYQNENAELEGLLSHAEDELLNTQSEVDIKREELEEAETKIHQLLAKVKLTEAESYYAQGEAMEEIARRTQFAPKRKKKALNDALEFFTRASDLGFESAKAKVDALKTRLKIV